MWCSTCGEDSETNECLYCEKWWKDNPPPTDEPKESIKMSLFQSKENTEIGKLINQLIEVYRTSPDQIEIVGEMDTKIATIDRDIVFMLTHNRAFMFRPYYKFKLTNTHEETLRLFALSVAKDKVEAKLNKEKKDA
jgi:hypothetical protein